jgi:hypothetical protein
MNGNQNLLVMHLDIQEAVVLRDKNYMRLDQVSTNLPQKDTKGLPKSLIEADLAQFSNMYQRNQMPTLKISCFA